MFLVGQIKTICYICVFHPVRDSSKQTGQHPENIESVSHTIMGRNKLLFELLVIKMWYPTLNFLVKDLHVLYYNDRYAIIEMSKLLLLGYTED